MSIGTAAGAVGSLTLDLARLDNSSTYLNVGDGSALLAVGANGGTGMLDVKLGDYGDYGSTRSMVETNAGLQIGAGAGSTGVFNLSANDGAPFRSMVSSSQYLLSIGGSVGSQGGEGRATIDNASWNLGEWQSPGTLHGLLVGDGAGSVGTVDIQNGGWVYAFDQPSQYLNLGASVRIGNNGGTGAVTVEGVNTQGTASALSSGKGLSIGHGEGGNGNLNILSGGKGVSVMGMGYSQDRGSMSVQAGLAGGSGNILVSGAGSILQVLGWFDLGPEGGTGDLLLGVGSGSTGQLTLADAGIVEIGTATLVNDPWTGSYNFLGASAGNACYGYPDSVPCGYSNGLLHLAPDAGATGTLNIGAALGETATAPGALWAGAVVFGQGSSSVVFNHTNNDSDYSTAYNFTTPLSSAELGFGKLDVHAGTTWLSTNNKDGFTLTRREFNPDTWELTKDVAISGFSGETNLYGGALGLDNDYALGVSTIYGRGEAADQATLIYGKNSGVTIANTLTIDDQKTLFAQVNAGVTSTQSGQLVGEGSLQKTGAGTLVLSHTTSEIGEIKVAEGALQFTQHDNFHLTTPFKVTGNYTTEANATTRLDNSDSTLEIGGEFNQKLDSNLIINTRVSSPDIIAKTAVLDGHLTLNGFSYSDPSSIFRASALEATQTTIIRTTHGITNAFQSTDGTSTTLGPDYLVGTGFVAANELTSTGGQDYRVGFTLAWDHGGQADGTGNFSMGAGSAFNVDQALVDMTSTLTGGFSNLGWDGKSLIKNGDGLLILSAANTYTGSTTLNGGTLQLTANRDVDDALVSDGSIASSSALTLNAGTFDVSGIDATGTSAKELSGAAGSAIALGDKTLTVNNTADRVVGSVISGSGALNINAGTNTTILSGENTYSGQTTLTAGTLQIGAGGDSGSLKSSQINAANGTAVVFDRSDDSVYAGKLNGAGTASLSKDGAGTLALSGLDSQMGSVSVNNGTLAFEQGHGDGSLAAFAVSGDYITKTNATTEIGKFGSTLTITGKFTQEAGSILNVTTGMSRPDIIANTADLAGTLNLTGFRWDDPNTILTASYLRDNGTTIIQTSTGISCDGMAATAGQQCFDVVTGASTTIGPDYLVGSGWVVNKGGTAQNYEIGFGLAWNQGGQADSTGSFTVADGSAFNVDVVLENKTGPFALDWDGESLSKEGAGTLILSKENTYTGETTVEGGTLALLGVGNIASSSAVTLKNTGSTLDLNGLTASTSLQNLTGTTGTKVVLGSTALTIDYNTNPDNIIASVISGAGGALNINAGSNILSLTAANTYTGGTTLTGGTLALLGAGNIASSQALTLEDAGTLDLTALTGSTTVQNLAGAADTKVLFGTGILRVNSNANAVVTSGETTFAGDLISDSDATAGNLQLIKEGAGTLTLSGNTDGYVGRTGVMAGTLVLDGSEDGAAQLTSDVLAKAGSTLRLKGAAKLTGDVTGQSGDDAPLNLQLQDAAQLIGHVTAQSGVDLQMQLKNDALLTGNVTGQSASQLLQLQDDAKLIGNVTGVAGSGVQLKTRAILTGKITASNVNLANTSVWNMTANSNVGKVENFAGSINFANPGATLTVGRTLTATDWVGQGGVVNLYAKLGDSDSISDRIVIDGGAATGTTKLNITNVGGLGDNTSGNGITIVDAINNATTNAGAFKLANAGGTVSAGAYNYTLYRGGDGTLGTADDWFLRSSIDVPPPPPDGGGTTPPPDGGGTTPPPDGGGTTPPPDGGGTTPPPDGGGTTPPPDGGGTTPPPDNGGNNNARPNYRPETSLFSATANQALRYDAVAVGTLYERMGNIDELNRQNGRLGWGRVIARHDKNDGASSGIYDSSIAAKGDISALQVGTDFYVNSAGAGRTSVGGFITAGQSDADITHVDALGQRVAAGSNKLTAFSVAGYLTHLDGSGAYLDSVVQATSFKVNNQPNSSASNSTRAVGLTASLEVGKRFAIGDAQQGYSITPQAQVVLQSLKINDTEVGSDVGSSAVRFDRSNSAQWRLGARFARTWTAVSGSGNSTSIWLTPSLIHTSGGATQTRFATPTQGDVVFRDELPGTRIGLQAGVEGQLSKTVSVNARLGAERNVGGDKQTSVFGQLGVKIAF